MLRRHQYIFFILPAVLIVLGLTAYPAIYGVYVSFTNEHLAFPDSRFVGFANYVRLLNWPALPGVIRNTVIFVGLVAFLQISLGLLMALLLNIPIMGLRALRSIAMLPWVLPGIIIALVFQQFFSGSKLGMMNTLISNFGLANRNWFGSPTEAFIVLIAVMVWRGTPLSIILQLSGLQTIPKELYEAASIDGANPWQRLLHITLPGLRPIMLIDIIMVTSATLNHVDIPLALTGGGPGRGTEVLALSIYKQGFEVLDAGYAATIATVILVINLVLIVIYLRLLRNR